MTHRQEIALQSARTPLLPFAVADISKVLNFSKKKKISHDLITSALHSSFHISDNRSNGAHVLSLRCVMVYDSIARKSAEKANSVEGNWNSHKGEG